MTPESPYRQVMGHAVRVLPEQGHERATHAWICAEIGRILCVPCVDSASGSPSAPAGTYHVPDDTLTLQQARTLGIHDLDSVLGGVVPHAFLATKVISHPLVDTAATAIEGWNPALARALVPATLPGHTAFSRADAYRAYALLRAEGGLRLKLPTGIGGRGQWRVDDETELKKLLEALPPDYLPTHGVVLERNLREVVTHSVGELLCAGIRIAYYGTQRSVRDLDGNEVYGGSDLHVRRGTLEALAARDWPAAQKRAISQACIYDRFIAGAYPDLHVSRRNYDVVTGTDEHGRPMCGVLEQSWRVGGATPAELAAVAAFQRDPALHEVRAATHESYLDDAPAGAEIYYRAAVSGHGPRLKYRTTSPVP
ncbi:DUF3182 family protein [Xanthomonas sp. Kuri4-1]